MSRMLLLLVAIMLNNLPAADVTLLINDISTKASIRSGKGYGEFFIDISFENRLNHAGEIPICSEIIEHLRAVDAHGHRVFIKDGAPILESPFENIIVPAGGRVQISKHIDLNRYYDYSKVAAISLWYDLRLIGIDSKRATECWVPWVPCLIELPDNH